MVWVPTYGGLLRAVADLMKENKVVRAEFEATVGRLEKRVDRLELENAMLRSRDHCRDTASHRRAADPGGNG